MASVDSLNFDLADCELVQQADSERRKDGPAVHGEPMTALERRSMSRESCVR